MGQKGGFVSSQPHVKLCHGHHGSYLLAELGSQEVYAEPSVQDLVQLAPD